VLDRLERKPSSQPNTQKARPKTAPMSEFPRIKATFYLNREDIVAIDRLQMSTFMETGKKPERSLIMSQAIQLFTRQTKVMEA
jgi:hypothetical protein